MTFEDVFSAIAQRVKHAHAGAVSEWVVVEFNVTGEGAGVFYMEIRNRILYIQPQGYAGSHLKITLDAKTLLALLSGEADVKAEWLAGNIRINGDLSKLKYLKRIEL